MNNFTHTKPSNLYKSLTIALHRESNESGGQLTRKDWVKELKSYIDAVDAGNRDFFKTNDIYTYAAKLHVGVRSLIYGARFIWGWRGYIRKVGV